MSEDQNATDEQLKKMEKQKEESYEVVKSENGDHQLEETKSDHEKANLKEVGKEEIVIKGDEKKTDEMESENAKLDEQVVSISNSGTTSRESFNMKESPDPVKDCEASDDKKVGGNINDVSKEPDSSNPETVSMEKVVENEKEVSGIPASANNVEVNNATSADKGNDDNEEARPTEDQKVENLKEKEQDSEDIFHEVPEATEEVQNEKSVVKEDNNAELVNKKEVSNVMNRRGSEHVIVPKSDSQNEEEWVNDGDPTDQWVDADEENDQDDSKVLDDKQEDGEEVAENEDYAENEDVVNEENGEDTLDDDEIAGNPAYIPKSPRYYMHDSRVVDEDESATRSASRVSRADGKWKHDKFDERSQAPKSKRELVVRYGFDIRNQDKASDTEGNRSTKIKSDSRPKDEPNVKNDAIVRNTNKSSAGGRSGRGGNMGRIGQGYNDRQGRDTHAARNIVPHQQQGRSSTYGSSRGRGNNRGIATNRGMRQVHLQSDHLRSGDGRFRSAQQREHPIQSKRPMEHVASRRGRSANFISNSDANSVPNNSRSNLPPVGGGGKRYSKQRTIPYSEQQRTLKISSTVPSAGTTVADVVTQINVPSLPSAVTVAAAAQQQHQPPPPRNPVDWQRGPPQPPPSAAFQAAPPIRPPLQAMAPPMQAQLSTIAAATVASVTPTAYRAPNDTVYFDPNEQIIRSTVPPQPRAKKRLEIVSPAD